MESKISVIVPVYNVESYLEKCVYSILNQTYKNLDIILINDGSTDSSAKICENFLKIDKRVRVFHKENGGLSSARNYGIEKAQGEYIGFVDSDDYIDSDMYEILYLNLKENKADLSMCGHYDVYEKNKTPQVSKELTYVLNSQDAIEMVMAAKVLSVTVVNKLYKRSIFNHLRFKEGKIAEDAFIMIELIDSCKKIVATNIKKYYYVHRNNSITTQNFSLKFLDVIEAYEYNYKLIFKKYPMLIHIAKMRVCWAYFYVLDKLLLDKNYKDNFLEKKLISYLRTNKSTILKSKYFKKERKLSYITLLFNKKIYGVILKKMGNR